MRGWTKGAIIALVAVGVGCGSMGWAWAQEEGRAGGSGKVFSDTTGHWAEGAITGAIAKGYVNGYEDGTFRPDAEVTRAEFIKLVVTALKLPVNGPATGADWYVPFVQSAVTNEVHQWSDFTTGDWNTPMSRYEMARMSAKATGEHNTEENKWMYLATKAGLIKGTDDTGTLDVEGTTTRAQAVTIIERILDIKAGKTLPADKHAVSRAEVLWHGTNIFTMWPRYFSEKDINKFDISKFQWDSNDGIYHEEVMYYVVVDNEDPNDPFRGETEGMTFNFYKYNEQGIIRATDRQAAPEKSYITVSKVKQEINGQYPKELWTTDGGRVYVDGIRPQDAINDVRKDWRYFYSNQESMETIYFSKDGEGQPNVEWNIGKGNNPVYVKNMPATGGTYYWVSAQVHPKGDNYSVFNLTTALHYKPNIAYMKTYGPNHQPVFESFADYKRHNE